MSGYKLDLNKETPLPFINRLEVVSSDGRDYVNMDTGEVSLQLQDKKETLKVFIDNSKSSGTVPVNLVEVASELAENELVNKVIAKSGTALPVTINNSLYEKNGDYKEHIQTEFNELYDYYYNLLNSYR